MKSLSSFFGGRSGRLNCSVLYQILKPVMRIAAWLAYRRIVHTGLSALENGRPTLILANHSASFMDAMLMAVFTKRRIHFFARGDVFAHPLADKILRSLGMMPVYRSLEGKALMHRNEETNADALKVLGAGGAILIFPEGISALPKTLKPLKKGPFRLAAMAAARGIAPVIVPVGINYVTPALAGGDVFIIAGECIDTEQLYQQGGEDEARLAISALRATEQAISAVVWDARSARAAALADDALLLMQQQNDGFSFREAEAAITALNAADDDSLTALTDKNELRSFLNMEAEEGKNDPVSVTEWIETIMLAPFAMAGLAFHYLPIYVAKRIAGKKVKEPDFYAPVFVGCAVVLVFLWYLLAAILLIIFCIKVILLLPVLVACGVLYRKWWSYDRE